MISKPRIGIVSGQTSSAIGLELTVRCLAKEVQPFTSCPEERMAEADSSVGPTVNKHRSGVELSRAVHVSGSPLLRLR